MALCLKYGKVTFSKGEVPVNEPVFILRGRDPYVEKYIRMYAEERKERGASAKEYSNILNSAEVFRNYEIKKPPS